MTTHTSLHTYNADRGLGFFQKFFYLFLNWVNNWFPYVNVDKRISIRPFTDEGWKEQWSKTYPSSSASRKLSDIFWRTLPWKKIDEELGGINIFDTGCGSGHYGLRINDASGGAVVSYTGIDAKEKPNWPELQAEHPNFHLIKSTSSDIRPLIPRETNLFITQSAIEHFDEDLVFFERVREYINKTDRPVIQVHLFPAAATLPLYIFHGIRQYTPKNVSKITRLFDDSSKFFLYGLGGSESKKIHWKYFTWPVLILRKYIKPTFDIEPYDKELRRAVEHDMKHPSSSPMFWALIIHSHPKKNIW
jgi:hypothetical protein